MTCGVGVFRFVPCFSTLLLGNPRSKVVKNGGLRHRKLELLHKKIQRKPPQVVKGRNVTVITSFGI